MKKQLTYIRKVIQLDPERSVAYLNLGDSLRDQLPHVDTFEEKIELTKKIKHAYLQYNKLHGKSTPAIDSFLAFNVVDTPIADFCEYVTAYANRGRLRDVFGSGDSVLKADESGTMRVDIAYGGTANIPWVRSINNDTNEDMSDAEYNNEIGEHEEDTRETQEIAHSAILGRPSSAVL